MPSEQRRIQNLDFIAGQVHALLAFALASVHAHPNLTLLSIHISRAEQGALGRTEATTVSDDFLDGEIDVFERLKAVATADRTLRERCRTPE